MLAITVAPAEPAASQPNPWMNRGLSTMLTAVPATEPIMDCTAWPSVRSRLDGVIDTMMNGEPTIISV